MPIGTGKLEQLVIENTLRGCQLFVGLPASDISAIAEFVVSKQLDKGDYLFREGDFSEGFYVVQKGAINVHRASETLSRTLGKFRDQKLLRGSGKTIVIAQPRKLDALLRKHLGET